MTGFLAYPRQNGPVFAGKRAGYCITDGKKTCFNMEKGAFRAPAPIPAPMSKRTFTMRILLSLATVISVAAAPVAASANTRPPLSEVKEITDGIMVLGIANTIRRRCDGISGRMIRGWSYVQALKARANELGYSDTEIRALLDDKAAEKRLIDEGLAYVESKGVDRNDPASLCAFGREEIKKSSLIGSFLRAN